MEIKEIMVRVLIPTTTAEILTSNGGQHLTVFTIINNVNMKLTEREEYYPGTNERLCYIMGELSNVIAAINVIMVMTDNDEHLDAQRRQEIKIVIYNHEAGRIIGRGGKHLRTIMQQSGSVVKISSKQNSEVDGDRCITIKGNQASNNKACKMLLTIRSDLDDNNNNNNNNNNNDRFMRSTVEVIIKVNNPDDVELKIADRLAYCGYREDAINEIMTALNVLAKYGVLSIVKLDGTEPADTNQDHYYELDEKPYGQTDGSIDEFRIHSHIRITRIQK